MSQTWITTAHSVTWWLFQCQETDWSQGRVYLGLLLLLSLCSSAFLSVLIKEWDWKKNQSFTCSSKSKCHTQWGLFGLLLGGYSPFFLYQHYNLNYHFSFLIPLLLFLIAQVNAMNVCGARSLKKSSANCFFSPGSQSRLASPPFASWQCLHVKWLHSWTVNSKACAPTAAWQEEVIFCMELKSLLSSSDLKNHFKKTFPPHIFWS